MGQAYSKLQRPELLLSGTRRLSFIHGRTEGERAREDIDLAHLGAERQSAASRPSEIERILTKRQAPFLGRAIDHSLCRGNSAMVLWWGASAAESYRRRSASPLERFREFCLILCRMPCEVLQKSS